MHVSDPRPTRPAESFSPEFLAVLREFMPHLEPGTDPSPDVALSSYGLDSLALISLMLELEDRLGVTFPDESMTQEAFATARALSDTVSALGHVPS